MPTSLRIGPYRFFFMPGIEMNRRIHICNDDAEAKFWISPVRLAWNRGFSGSELRQIEKIVEKNELQLIQIWDEYFNDNQ